MALFDIRGKGLTPNGFDSSGDAEMLKMVLLGKAVQVYSGFAGTITDIKCHPEYPIIASCGLDRFVRVHNLNTKELLQKV